MAKRSWRARMVARALVSIAALVPVLVIRDAPAQAVTTAPNIEVVGNQIVATSAGQLGVQQVVAGQAITLRGVNLSGAEYSCDSGRIWDNPPGNLTTIGHIRDDWAANTVRVPLNEGYWLGLGGKVRCRGSNYRNAISKFVGQATSNGLIVEVDLHFGIGARTDDYPIFDTAHAAAFWTSIADTFKSDHSVIFNLINEPHDVTWSCLMQGIHCATGTTGVKPVLDAVRNAGASNPVIIAGLNWSDDLGRWMQNVPVDPLETTDPALGSQLIAGFHPYFGLGNRCEMDPPRCWNHEIAPIQTTGYTGPDGELRTYPVIADEFGDVSSRCSGGHIKMFMKWADAQGPPIGYWAWTFTVVPCSDPGLIRNAAGTPTSSYGSTFKAHLIAVQGHTDGREGSPGGTNADGPFVGYPSDLDTTYGWVMNDQVHPGADHVHPGADEDGYCHTCDYIAGLERDALEQRALVYVGNGLWVDAVALVDAADKERPPSKLQRA